MEGRGRAGKRERGEGGLVELLRLQFLATMPKGEGPTSLPGNTHDPRDSPLVLYSCFRSDLFRHVRLGYSPVHSPPALPSRA